MLEQLFLIQVTIVAVNIQNIFDIFGDSLLYGDEGIVPTLTAKVVFLKKTSMISRKVSGEL